MYTFLSDAGPFCVWLDVRCEPDFVLRPTSDPEMRGTPEGERLVF
jgi:hypothetical protein